MGASMTDEAPRRASLEAQSRAYEETARPAWLCTLAIVAAVGAHTAILIGFVAFFAPKPTPLVDARVGRVASRLPARRHSHSDYAASSQLHRAIFLIVSGILGSPAKRPLRCAM
jgi:hypothetical protein